MDTLAEALIDVIESKQAYDKAWSETEYDKGYFTYRERERLDNATKRFEEVLNQLIDKRIEERKTL